MKGIVLVLALLAGCSTANRTFVAATSINAAVITGATVCAAECDGAAAGISVGVLAAELAATATVTAAVIAAIANSGGL